MKLINKKYLALYGPWPKNYNYDEIEQYEDITINIWIRPILGDALLSELLYQIEKNEVSETNSSLLTDGGLWRYLCYCMAYESLPMAAYKLTEVGLVKSDSDNSKSVDTKEYNIVQEHLRRQVEALKDQLISWLCERREHFPLMNECICPGCCCDKGLNTPNPNWKIYSTKKRITELN